jgi:hypothetical protein
MASETGTVADRSVESSEWLYGAIGGIVGTIIYGLMHQFIVPSPVLTMVIPAMYGIAGPALAVGWAFHLFHGIVIALVYVAIVELTGLSAYAHRLRSSIGLGIGYGILITAVLPVIVLPLWLSVVGFPQAPPFPNLSIPGTIVSLIGHTIYSIIVAGIYAGLTR